MRINSCEISNKKYVQIYLTEDEFNKQETKNILEEYKQKNYSVATFITGKENYPEILKKIVKKQVEISHYLC